jgi:hypothetical protein
MKLLIMQFFFLVYCQSISFQTFLLRVRTVISCNSDITEAHFIVLVLPNDDWLFLQNTHFEKGQARANGISFVMPFSYPHPPKRP